MSGEEPLWGRVVPGPPLVTPWQEALLAHLEKLTAAVERVEGRLVALEAALVKRGSL